MTKELISTSQEVKEFKEDTLEAKANFRVSSLPAYKIAIIN